MTEPMDKAKDPDRFDTEDKTLPQLLGDGAQESERNNLTWLLGLVGVIAFLAVVSVLVQLGSR